MFIGHFTERPWQDPKSGLTGQVTIDMEVSNRLYDPKVGRQLYNRYLDERVYAEEVGFDGVAMNEHHSTPFCMGGVVNVEAHILARITNRVKIVIIGNLLPLWDDPLWLAEQIAVMDMISGGRVVCGWVRGTGRESISHNINPTINWERYQEAHDFVIKTWTTPGPFRWEGKHLQYRYVNPWMVPYQNPHPPIWIPGAASRATVKWAATNGFPYVMIAGDLALAKLSFDYYKEVAAESGYQSGTEHVLDMVKVHVDETEQLAEETARKYLGGVSNPFIEGNEGGVRPWVQGLPGLNPRTANARMPVAATLAAGRGGAVGRLSFEDQVKQHRIIYGTPKTVMPKIRHVVELLRPGGVIFWDGDGSMTHDDQMRSLRLFGSDVIRATRELGKELDLKGPFDVTPVTGMTLAGRPGSVSGFEH
ncbi:MAG: LLM class flavin-dependent oxidoreductase [Dehalococcoidia bacterium]|nr:LLM class flavin-dependent oxidoreductase [Dehalococcoidia bacterium]